MNELDFVAFRGVYEGDAAAVGFEVRPVGEPDALLGDVLAEGFEAVHLEGEVGEVRLNLDRAAVGEKAEFDSFLAFGGFQEDEFGAPGGFVAANLFQAEDFTVKPNGTFEVIHPVTGMEELESEPHGGRIGGRERVGEAAGWE